MVDPKASAELRNTAHAGESEGLASPDEEAPSHKLSEELLGQLIGDRYRVEALLGEGGMGSVFLAEHELMRKKVALKVLHQEMTGMPEAVRRFEREAIASGRIHHPNVVNATDFGKLPSGACYLVLDYVSGISLTDVIAQAAPLPRNRALHIAEQIVAALEAAHDAGVVHRDLKPDNVMLVESGGDLDFAKVLDFGIAKLENQGASGKEAQLTRQGSVFGTPEYMSPEQASGNPADSRADLYSVGVLLYEMLSGSTPFKSDNILALLTKHLNEPPSPLPASVAPDLSAVVMRLLAKAPADRYQTAGELLRTLRTCSALSRPPPPRARYSQVFDLAVREFRAVRWPSKERRSQLVALATRRFLVFGRSIPLWGFAGAFLGLGVVATALNVWINDDSDAPLAPLSLEAMTNDTPALTELLERAAAGRPAAIEQLKRLPNKRRSSAVWLHLGHGYAQQGQFKPSLAAYGQAVARTPALANNSRMLNNVLRAAWSPAQHQRALSFASRSLGSAGADLLFYIWIEKPPKHDADLDVKAKKWLLTDAKRNASPALKVALGLYTAKSCSDSQDLLGPAIADGDQRALTQLKKRQTRSGCGFLSLKDCYQCLRGNDRLESAISATSNRPAPKFQRPRETPSVTAATPAVKSSQ